MKIVVNGSTTVALSQVDDAKILLPVVMRMASRIFRVILVYQCSQVSNSGPQREADATG